MSRTRVRLYSRGGGTGGERDRPWRTLRRKRDVSVM